MDAPSQDFTQNPEAQFQASATSQQSQQVPQPQHGGRGDQLKRENQFQGLIDAYEGELQAVDESSCPNVAMLVRNELFRLRGGVIDTVDVLSSKKTKVRTKVDIPVETYPNLNFVGKLLGPAGKTLKSVQEQTNTKMSILGAGSLRNPEKEAELLVSGDPKFNHLRDRLHLQIDSIGNPSEAYYNISFALSEVKKVMSPDANDMGPGPMGGMGQVTPLMSANSSGGYSSMRNPMQQQRPQRGRGGGGRGRGGPRGGGSNSGPNGGMGGYGSMNGGGFETGFSDDYSMGFEGYGAPMNNRGGGKMMGQMRGLPRNAPYSRPM